MTQRSRAKLLYVAVCAASALLCALNRAPVLAVVNGVAALVVFRVRFGLALESPDVDTLIGELRDARTAEAEMPSTIRATVMSNFIAVPSSAKRWVSTGTAFRDEITSDQWRRVTTALRHQPRPTAWSALTTKNSGTQFAKRNDL